MTTPNAPILIASLDPTIQELWSRLRIDGINSQLASCFEEAQELISSAEHSLLVLDSSLGDDARRLYELARGGASIPLLLLTEAGSEPFTISPTPATLEERVQKPAAALELAFRVKALMVRAGYEVSTPAPAAPQAVPTPGTSAPENTAEDGSLIAVFSVKGGAGKSTVSVNLAVGLAQLYQRRTLLVDADVWFGDLGVLLNVTSPKSLSDICDGDQIDLFGLPKAVVPHESGLSLLLRPPDPARVEKLNPVTLANSLITYKALYQTVLVDTGPNLDDINLQILDVADRVLLVITPELPTIHNCARFLAVAETLGHANKIALVLNRANSGIEPKAIEHALGMPIFAQVVSAGRLVVESVNAGTSILQCDPLEREEITQNLIRLVTQVAGKPRPDPRSIDSGKRRFPFFRKVA